MTVHWGIFMPNTPDSREKTVGPEQASKQRAQLRVPGCREDPGRGGTAGAGKMGCWHISCLETGTALRKG